MNSDNNTLPLTVN
ncbi:unnamed protein product, partial [Rotaria sp. Silwood2]